MVGKLIQSVRPIFVVEIKTHHKGVAKWNQEDLGLQNQNEHQEVLHVLQLSLEVLGSENERKKAIVEEDDEGGEADDANEVEVKAPGQQFGSQEQEIRDLVRNLQIGEVPNPAVVSVEENREDLNPLHDVKDGRSYEGEGREVHHFVK